MKGIATNVNGTNQSIVSNIQYRGDAVHGSTNVAGAGRAGATSQMLSCTYGNGLNDTRSYDLQGRLTSQRLFEPTADDTLDQRAYTYDKNSNITAININGEATEYDRGYIYDRLDRLTSDGVGEDDPVTYSYDLNDNRQTRKQGTGIDSIDELIDYIEGSNRIEEMDTLKRGTGQVIVIPDRTMTYSDTGRLYQLTENGTLKAEYIYNDLGQRTKKTLYQSDGITVDTTTIYHYDQMGHLITETTETGTLIKDYIWNEMHPVAQIDNNGGTETIAYLYTDHLMTARLATNNNGIITWCWEGEAFGNTPARELSGVSINLRFPGQYFDAETNLHYNWNRYYDPSIGRYITSDPIGLDGGLNTYLYANANPIVRFDVLGFHGTHIYGDVDTYWGAEINVIIGGGLTVVTCQDECDEERKMVFAKVCLGLAAGGTAGAGVVNGLDGESCKPETYDELFFEAGAAVGHVGIGTDIGLFPLGVVEGGPTVGVGVQIASLCYYIYIGDW